MSGLILKLRPGETILVNGALIENGERKSQLRIRSKCVNILRLRHAMRPDEATTPARKLYYAAQQVVAGEAGASESRRLANIALAQDEELPPDARDAVREALDIENFYAVMRTVRPFVGEIGAES